MAGFPANFLAQMAEEAERELHEGNLCCDWCGQMIDEGACAMLHCRRPTCGRNAYHQACVEAHLRKHKFPPDRLAGFPCLRGHGRKTTVAEPCNGKIDSTHKRIIPRKSKKDKKPAPIVVPPARPPPAVKAKPTAQAPTPVRSGGRTPAAGCQAGAHAGGTVTALTQAQMKALAATIRRELKSKFIITHDGQGSDAVAVAAIKPKPVPKAFNPGEGAAARLGTGKAQQQAYIPGMEPADPAPASARVGRRWATLTQPKPPPVPAALPPPIPLHDLQEPKVGRAINALESSDSCGFVTDLERYNAILRMQFGDDALDDDFDNPGGMQAPVITAAPPAEPVAAHADDEEWEQLGDMDVAVNVGGAPNGAGLEGLYLTDEQLAMAYLYGPERAGLPVEFAALVQQLYGEYGTPGAGGPDGGLLLEPHTPEQVAEMDHAAYLDAERVVLEDERAQAQAREREQAATEAALAAAEAAAAQLQAQLAQAYQAHLPLPVAVSGTMSAVVPAAVVTPPLPWAAGGEPVVQAVPAAAMTAMPFKAVQPPNSVQLLADEGVPANADVDEELFGDILSLCLA